MLVCMGDGGSVALSFRGATTRPLAWDSSSATVRAALLELPTLRGGAGDEAFGDQREMLPRPLNAQLTGRAVSVLYDNGEMIIEECVRSVASGTKSGISP